MTQSGVQAGAKARARSQSSSLGYTNGKRQGFLVETRETPERRQPTEARHQNNSINRSIESHQSLDIGPLPNRIKSIKPEPQYRPVAESIELNQSINIGPLLNQIESRSPREIPQSQHLTAYPEAGALPPYTRRQSFEHTAIKQSTIRIASISRIKSRHPDKQSKRIILDHSKSPRVTDDLGI